MYFQVCVCILLVVPSYTRGGLPAPSESCDRLEREVSSADRATEILHPPPLQGKWVSQRCEVRPGPQFLLRSHVFLANNSYRLTQFHYSDEACAQPLYSVTARGRFTPRGRSWLSPGASDLDYSLTRVSVTPHTLQMAEEMAASVNATCPGAVRRRWRPYREYTVLSVAAEWPRDLANNVPALTTKKSPAAPANLLGGKTEAKQGSSEDIDCLAALNMGFNELQLVRVQKRPPDPLDPRPRLELLLGDIPTRPGLQGYRPSAFQTPLLRADLTEGCDVCRAVGRGWERAPPQLLTQPRLPPLLTGEWVSGRCETRPLGLFLTRRLLVLGRRFRADYRFFSDAACSQRSLAVRAEGRLAPALQGPAGLQGAAGLQGTAGLDLHVERAALTPLDPGLLPTLQRDRHCGSDPWQVGVPQNVSVWQQGCAPLGLLLAAVQYEVARVEISPLGTPLLLLGQADSELPSPTPRERPSSFQPPLVRCAGELPSSSHFLQLPPLYSGAGAGAEAASRVRVAALAGVACLGLKYTSRETLFLFGS